jgi:hypothetical protein
MGAIYLGVRGNALLGVQLKNEVKAVSDEEANCTLNDGPQLSRLQRGEAATKR